MMSTLCIGSYAEPDTAGVYIAELNPHTGSLRIIRQFIGLVSPTFVLPDRERGFVYAGEHGTPGAVAVMDAETGEILSRISSGGVSPCHMALNEEKTLLSVSNYSNGSIELIRLNGQGMPEEVSDLRQEKHSGQHPVRQTGSHVHFSAFCGNQLYVCDLGANTIFRYDVVNGQLCNEAQPFMFPPAVGPRHFVVKDEIIYVITEMGGCIYAYSMPDGHIVQTVPLLDDVLERETIPVIDVDAFGSAIKISPDGHWLLASIRGTDKLQLFRIEADGSLTRRCTSPSGGRIPREAGFYHGYILAANQVSNNICTFTFDEESGTIQGPIAELSISRPTCIQLL